jgi:predicted DNA-binding transcriptional regulator AlpA
MARHPHDSRFLSLSQLAARLGVRRQQLAEWVRLGILPAPARFGVRQNGRPVAYLFSAADLPALTRLVSRLKQGGIPKR